MLRLRPSLFVLAVSICAPLLTGSCAADEKEKSASDAGGHVLKPFSKDFLRLSSSVVGTWKGQMTDEVTGEKKDVVVEYRLSSGNSVLVETLMKGSPDEMISVYHDDNDGILMTHYCGLGNQPRMKARKFTDNKLEFRFIDGSNMASPKEMHMGGLRLTLVDENHLEHEWQLFMDGKPVKEHKTAFRFERMKK